MVLTFIREVNKQNTYIVSIDIHHNLHFIMAKIMRIVHFGSRINISTTRTSTHYQYLFNELNKQVP